VKTVLAILIIGIILVVIGILLVMLFVGFNQSSQSNSEIDKIPVTKSQPIQKEPTKSETKIESKTEPVKEVEPVKTEPVKEVEPVKTEPVKEVEPVKTESNIICSGKADCIRGKVTKINDGDTIKVNGISIRFALTSTPELGKSGGIEARDYIEKICPVGSEAVADEDDGQTGGSYGRTIAKIYCNGIILNESILEAKLGTISTNFCAVSEFGSESWAQKFGCN
jgi:micrococcal nuclease